MAGESGGQFSIAGVLDPRDFAVAVTNFAVEEGMAGVDVEEGNERRFVQAHENEGDRLMRVVGWENDDSVNEVLDEFWVICNDHYAALAVVSLGIGQLRGSMKWLPGEGTIAFVSRPSDFQRPSVLSPVPKIDVGRFKTAIGEDADVMQYQFRALLVFIYQLWEDSFRGRVADLCGVPHRSVMCDVMGDLRLVRIDLVHRNRRVSEGRVFRVLKGGWLDQGEEWTFSFGLVRDLMDAICRMRVEIAGR